MTEKDFWLFLNGQLTQGRAMVASGTIDCMDPVLAGNPELVETGRFLGGHSLLPDNVDKVAVGKIKEIGGLLLGGRASLSTKEAIMMFLAHHPSKEALDILKAYNAYPDRELKVFAEMAQDECEMWNEE